MNVSNHTAEHEIPFLIGLFFGLALGAAVALCPDTVVFVTGEAGGVLVVEYEDKTYRLERLE